jgi:hypothetical protein
MFVDHVIRPLFGPPLKSLNKSKIRLKQEAETSMKNFHSDS